MHSHQKNQIPLKNKTGSNSNYKISLSSGCITRCETLTFLAFSLGFAS